jgi:hypothetical protein
MPDIGTALRQALNDWEPPVAKPEPAPAPASAIAPAKPYFTVTNNVTRATFDYVRDNPGKTRIEVADALRQKGFNAKSVSSLLGQMLKQGMMRESAHLLYVTTNEYTPIKASKKLKAMAAKQQAPQRKVVKIVSTRTGEVFNAPPAPQINAAWNVTDQLNSMSIVQARLMYDALRKIFGG